MRFPQMNVLQHFATSHSIHLIFVIFFVWSLYKLTIQVTNKKINVGKLYVYVRMLFVACTCFVCGADLFVVDPHP